MPCKAPQLYTCKCIRHGETLIKQRQNERCNKPCSHAVQSFTRYMQGQMEHRKLACTTLHSFSTTGSRFSAENMSRAVPVFVAG